MSTYSDKLAELRATAEGGMSGRQAYKEGRERLISDQRAAIDAAMAAPVRFEAGTAGALNDIIAPVGDAAAARIDFAGERHGTSMDSLDSALSRALSQHAGARNLNYNQTLADARLATDRSMELANIQRAQQEAAASGGSGGGNYSQSEQKAAAEALGGMAHEQAIADLAAYQTPEFKRELSRISGRAFSHIRDPKERQALLQQVLDAGSAGDMGAVLELVDEHAPQARGDFTRLAGAVGSVANVVREGVGLKPLPPSDTQQRAADLDAILADVANLQALQGQNQRQLEADRYLFNQDAYSALFGDPLLAAGIFPKSLPEDMMEANADYQDFIETGLYGSDLAKQREQDNDELLANLAAGAGLSRNIIDDTLDDLPVDATEVYAMLGDGDTAAVVSEAVQSGVAAARTSGGSGNKRDLAASEAAAAVQAALAGADPQYVQALALIAAEQARVYARVG